MTVRVETGLDCIRIVDKQGELTPATKSTLRLRGFTRSDNGLAAEQREQEDLVIFLLDLFQDAGVQFELDEAAAGIIRRRETAHHQLEQSCDQGRAIKRGDLKQFGTSEFVSFLANGLKRRLLPHQVKQPFTWLVWHTEQTSLCLEQARHQSY